MQPSLECAHRGVRREVEVGAVGLPSETQRAHYWACDHNRLLLRLDAATQVRAARRRLQILSDGPSEDPGPRRWPWWPARRALTPGLVVGAQLLGAPRVGTGRWLQVVRIELRLQLCHSLAEASQRVWRDGGLLVAGTTTGGTASLQDQA